MERVEGVKVGEAKAVLQARFRRRLAVGAWRDFYSHLHARVPYINPSPAAEAKLLARRAEEERAWLDKRQAVKHRRLDEGESLAHRAGAGRGGGAGMSAGGALSREMGEQAATEFLAGVFGRGGGGLGRAGQAVLAGGLAGGGPGGQGGYGVGVAAGQGREGQRAQMTATRSTGDGMPAMGGDSASEDEPGEQQRGGGSFCSLGSSLERMGGSGATTSKRSGVGPKLGRWPGAGPQRS